jgi:hypothetical protein
MSALAQPSTPANTEEVAAHGPQVVAPNGRPNIDHLPLDVQARIVLIEAIGSYAGSMVSRARAIREPGA